MSKSLKRPVEVLVLSDIHLGTSLCPGRSKRIQGKRVLYLVPDR
jgi:hypothetical protein